MLRQADERNLTTMKRYRVEPGWHGRLKHWDPAETQAFPAGKEKAAKRLAKLGGRLAELQERLYAERRHRLLIVLQGMDTAGKDGTIRHVFQGVNPQGVRVASFKKPTPQELAHDFLWRVHAQAPQAGEIVIFNRSHYEDVLVARVHRLAPEEVWRQRYEHINHFERLLCDEGATILKFYLHIGRREQRERLLARLNDPDKQWKLSPDDARERKLWPQYMRAYEDVLRHTSTRRAPWYVIPANHKWYRNLLISETIVRALKDMRLHKPLPTFDLRGFRIP